MNVFPLAVLLCLVAGLSYAQSQGLPKQEPTKPTETKQYAPTYDRGTKELPVIIEIGPSTQLRHD